MEERLRAIAAETYFGPLERGEKGTAWSYVKTATKSGLLPALDTVRCDGCGAVPHRWHHPDHRIPGRVYPLCMTCHWAIHKMLGTKRSR